MSSGRSLGFFGLLLAALIVISVTVWADDKVIHEPYPWPNAEYPSREKPMRRDLSEPLEFGTKYPKPGAEKAPQRKSSVKAARKSSKVKKQSVKPKMGPPNPPVIVVRPPAVVIAPTRPEALPPGYPVPRPGTQDAPSLSVAEKPEGKSLTWWLLVAFSVLGVAWLIFRVFWDFRVDKSNPNE